MSLLYYGLFCVVLFIAFIGFFSGMSSVAEEKLELAALDAVLIALSLTVAVMMLRGGWV